MLSGLQPENFSRHIIVHISDSNSILVKRRGGGGLGSCLSGQSKKIQEVQEKTPKGQTKGRQDEVLFSSEKCKEGQSTSSEAQKTSEMSKEPFEA